MRSIVAASLILFSTVCFSAEPVKPSIRLPVSKIPITPASVTVLAIDSLFVIDADEEYLIIDSREGIVAVSQEVGPMTIRSVFADGNGKAETRKYTAKHLWLIEAIKEGEVEIVISKVGEKDRTKVIRTTLLVGHGPRPPPIPPAPVPPTPVPPDPEPAKSALLTAIIVEDALQRTPATAAIIADLGFWKSIEKQVDNLHVVPSIAPLAAQYKRQLDAAKGVLPLFILLDSKTRKVIYSGSLPADKVAVASLVNKYTK